MPRSFVLALCYARNDGVVYVSEFEPARRGFRRTQGARTAWPDDVTRRPVGCPGQRHDDVTAGAGLQAML